MGVVLYISPDHVCESEFITCRQHVGAKINHKLQIKCYMFK